MTEAEWTWNNKPFPMWGHVRSAAAIRKLRLYALACLDRVCARNDDERLRRVASLLDRSAEGLTTTDEVETAVREMNTTEVTSATDIARWACWTASDRADTRYYSGGVASCAVLHALSGLTPRKAKSVRKIEEGRQVTLLQDIFGNPFRPVTFAPEWRTDTVLALARQMYESRDFSAMPILADALQDAGCDNIDILNHCRSEGLHVRGCWVCDLVLGKE